MRRLIFPLICSSSKAANLLKPTGLGIASSPVRLFLLPEGGENVKVCEFRSHLGKLGRLKEMKTMTVYLIGHVKVTDDGWVPAYAASVHGIVHKDGGKYLSRSGNMKTLEGKALDTTLIALLQFPSAEAAEAFVTDPEYAPYAAARQGGSDSRFPADRRHRSGGNNSLSAERVIGQGKQSQCLQLDLVHVRTTCNAKLPARAP